MKRPSIALRLSLGLAVGTALLWVGAAAIAGTVMQRELNEALDDNLKQSAYRLLPLAIHDLREPGERDDHRVSRLEADEAFITYYVRDRSGHLLVAAEDAPIDATSMEVPDGFSNIDGKRAFSATDPRSGFGIVVVERTNHRADAVRDSLAALTWPLAALIPLIVAGIWFAVRLAMRPVERLRLDIEKRNSRDLSPPADDNHPIELSPIADAVAGLLERLQAALNAERAFAASSAHELRTPIAGALAQTQQLAIEIGDSPGSERLREIENALRHLSQLAEKLLQLARLDAGFARSSEKQDLMPVLRLVIGDFWSRPDITGRVQFEAGQDIDLEAMINVDAFSIAIRNLINNALMHGPSGGKVLVVVTGGATIHVINEGPKVPAEILDRLGQPFVRGTTRANGSGLGLSIVRAIMEQTGGELELMSPAAGREDGFEAILRLG